MRRETTVAQSAVMISIFTLISKFLGFLREVMIASRFGSGMETDTYFVAMTATVIIVGALGSALNTTLVPIFSEIGEKFGRKGKQKYLNNVINLVIIASLILIVIGFFGSPLVMKILAKGFEGEQLELAVKLNRIGLPIIMMLALTHVLAGYLHSGQIFGPPAVAGIPYNIIFLIYLGFFAADPKIESLMVVTVIGTLMQLLTHVPAVKYSGYEFKAGVDLQDPFLKKAMRLIGPVILGSAVQQINVVIDKTLASGLREGSVSALNYSSRINDMVIAVFVMAITTVVFPMLADAFAKEDNRQVKVILGQGVNIILLITVPATVGIMLLAEPIVHLFFERGAFDATATLMTSRSLIFYSVGLIGASLRLLLNRVYYSFQDTKTPMVNGMISVGINVVLNLILVRYMSYAGLALATSIAATISTIFLFINLRRKMGPIGVSHYIKCFIKTGIASFIMGIVVYLIYFKAGSLVSSGKVMQILMLGLSVIAGIIVYFAICIVLGVKEVGLLVSKFTNR